MVSGGTRRVRRYTVVVLLPAQADRYNALTNCPALQP
jgi:hypothetical protein